MSYTTQEKLPITRQNPVIKKYNKKNWYPVIKLKVNEELPMIYLSPYQHIKKDGSIWEGHLFLYNNQTYFLSNYYNVNRQLELNHIQPYAKVIVGYYGDIPSPKNPNNKIGIWKINYAEDFYAKKQYEKTFQKKEYTSPKYSQKPIYAPYVIKYPDILPPEKLSPKIREIYERGMKTLAEQNPPKLLRIYHYSYVNRPYLVVNPKYFGQHYYTKSSMQISPIKRSFFYTDKRDKEQMLPYNLYYGDVKINTLYDTKTDPKKWAETLQPNEFIYKVKKEKYFGILWEGTDNMKGDIVILFYPVKLKRYEF